MKIVKMSEISDENEQIDCLMAVPIDFFQYIGPAATKGNSLYRCLKCSSSEGNTISCHTKSRQLKFKETCHGKATEMRFSGDGQKVLG